MRVINGYNTYLDMRKFCGCSSLEFYNYKIAVSCVTYTYINMYKGKFSPCRKLFPTDVTQDMYLRISVHPSTVCERSLACLLFIYTTLFNNVQRQQAVQFKPNDDNGERVNEKPGTLMGDACLL